MGSTFSSSERALDEEMLRVERDNPCRPLKTVVEDSTIRKVIRDILSLPPKAQVPGSEEERRLLEKIICLVSFRNRKWLSEIQIALPYAQLTSEEGPKDATLKSKVPIRPVADDRKGTRQAQSGSPEIGLRNYFIELLAKCIPEHELNAFPHLLTLYNANKISSETTEQLSVVREAGAWMVLSRCQRLIYDGEFESRPKRKKKKINIREYSLERIQTIQESNLVKLQKSVAASNWRSEMASTAPSHDSLFTKLLINAALNRFILENWAFERRNQAVTVIHHEFLKEMQQTIPDGLLGVIDQYRVRRSIRYFDLAKLVLKPSLSKYKGALTTNLLNSIDRQSKAVVASARLKEYETESEVNKAFLRNPAISKAMIWLVLAWCYVNEKKIPDDSPELHAASSSPVSRRARLIEIGQNMVALRRLLSPLLLGHQHDLPSPERMLMHSRYVTNVRATMLRALVENFKGAAVSKWDSAFVSKLTEEAIAEKLTTYGIPMRPNQSQGSEMSYPTTQKK